MKRMKQVKIQQKENLNQSMGKTDNYIPRIKLKSSLIRKNNHQPLLRGAKMTTRRAKKMRGERRKKSQKTNATVIKRH